MEFFNYTLINIVSFLGIIVGYFLIFFAKEEKEPGMKYFMLTKYFTFFLIIFLSFHLMKELLMVLILIVLLILFFRFKDKQDYIAYGFFALIFYLISKDSFKINIIASLIFFYGLAVGAIMIDLNKKKESLFRILGLSYFVLISLLIYFI
jgi:hypothetical protein